MKRKYEYKVIERFATPDDEYYIDENKFEKIMIDFYKGLIEYIETKKWSEIHANQKNSTKE